MGQERSEVEPESQEGVEVTDAVEREPVGIDILRAFQLHGIGVELKANADILDHHDLNAQLSQDAESRLLARAVTRHNLRKNAVAKANGSIGTHTAPQHVAGHDTGSDVVQLVVVAAGCQRDIVIQVVDAKTQTGLPQMLEVDIQAKAALVLETLAAGKGQL